jgi:hypothetical protein
MDEWKASTPADLQSRLPGMYNLLTSGVTSMKLLLANGVLPGTGSAAGATATYNPSSQTCSGGCGLDGSGCGTLGNFPGDVNHCRNEGTTFVPSPSTPTSPTLSPVQAPTPTQSNCVDSSLKMLVNRKPRRCQWAARNIKRCERRDVRNHCPATCDGNCSVDSNKRFRIPNGKFKKCKWVARRRTAKRCAKPGIKETCRSTCA